MKYRRNQGVGLFDKENTPPIICEKGTRGHPLTDEQKERNRQKSKVRSRVEHVFLIHGADDGWPTLPRGRNDKGKSQHCVDKPRLQYVPLFHLEA